MLDKSIWSFRYALAELRNEWLFGCGVALAVCSVLTPIMLLWGAKTGVVEALRNRLLKDPRIRELSLVEGRPIPDNWFEGIRTDPRVGFVTPCVRQISLYGNASGVNPGKGKVEVAYLPTGPGDPVGDWGGGDLNEPVIPVKCMITSSVAESLSLNQGDEITLEQTRTEMGKVARASFTAVICSILSPPVSKASAVYLPLAVVERIEDYKDGRRVDLFGWKQGNTLRLERYDSIRIRPMESLRFGELLELNHSIVARRIVAEEPTRRRGNDADEFLEYHGGAEGIAYDDVIKIIRSLASIDPMVNLHVKPTNAFWVQANGGRPKEVLLKSSDEQWFKPEELIKALSSGGDSSAGSNYINLRINEKGGVNSRLKIMLPEGADVSNAIKLGPREAGVLGVARRRPVEYISSCADLRVLRTEYLGLRLYARNLDDVKPLRIRCAQDGIELTSQEDRIAQVLSLDRSLGKLFLFIALAGLLGGSGALFTSIYLSIERSKRQFAVLQILGIPTRYVLFATMVQGVLLVAAGTLAAFILYLCGSGLLQSALGSGLSPEESVCSLRSGHWLTALLAASGCALLAALVSGTRLRIKDPAVVARSE